MIYCVYYNCPKCKKPCDTDALQVTSECVEAEDEKQARIIFELYKPCVNMDIIGIEEAE